MEKNILNELENLSQNFDFLLEWLENSKQEVKSENNWDYISSEMTSYSQYFRSIDESLKKNNDIINAYINSVPNTLNENIEAPEVDNYNFNMMELTSTINKLNDTIIELNNSIENDIKTSLSIDIDKLKEELSNIQIGLNSEAIESLKNQISDKNIKININQDDILSSISELNDLTKNLETIKFNIDTQDTLDNIVKIKTELDSIQDLKFDNINFDILSNNNLDSVISKFNVLKNIDLSENLNNLSDTINNLNIDNVINSLENIKNINFENINLDTLKTNITEIESGLSKFTNLKLNFDVDFEIFDNIQERIKDISSNIITIKPIDIKFNQETLLNDINSVFDNYSLDIVPTINTDFLTQELEYEYDIKLNPIINLDNLSAEIETKLDTSLSYIKDSDINKVEDTEMKDILKQNNKLLNDLVILMSKNIDNKISENLKTEINNNQSNTIIKTENDKTTPDLLSAINGMKDINEKQLNALERLVRKTNKPSFNTNYDDI